MQNRYSERFRKIHRKAPEPDSVFNEFAGLQPAAILRKRPRSRCFPVNFVWFLRTSFLQNSSGRLLLTLEVHKVDKNIFKDFNRYIKVILIEAIFVILCQLWKWFCMFENNHSERLTKPQKFARKKYEAEFYYNQTIFLRLAVFVLMILKLMILLWTSFWKFTWDHGLCLI